MQAIEEKRVASSGPAAALLDWLVRLAGTAVNLSLGVVLSAVGIVLRLVLAVALMAAPVLAIVGVIVAFALVLLTIGLLTGAAP